jgi:isopenicillin N synthase-like dioxygenase
VPNLVPIVDLGAPDAPAQIDAACRQVGFLSIRGHGVATSVVDRMLTATDALFALALEDKLALQPSHPEVDRGYAAKGSEGLLYSLGDDTAPPDLFEAFNIGPDSWPAGDPVYERERHRVFAPNLWPDHPATADLRPALLAYFEEVRLLAHRLTDLFADALGLPTDFFEDKTDHCTETMRVNHYRRAPGDPDPLPGQQRMGAHSDYGILTILYADRVPGLQIVGPDGAWHDVQPAEGAFLVNLGDLLAQWTNDRWRSTLHRVVPPPRSVTGSAVRRSVAFFHDGNYDALVECLPTCCSAENPPRYPPVVAGDHILAKLMGPRVFAASEAMTTAGDRPVR